MMSIMMVMIMMGSCRCRDCDDGADEEDGGHGNDYAVFMTMSNELTTRTRLSTVLKFADTIAVDHDDDDDEDADVGGDDGHGDKFEAAVNTDMTAMTSIGDDTDDNGDDRDSDAACDDDGDNRGHNDEFGHNADDDHGEHSDGHHHILHYGHHHAVAVTTAVVTHHGVLT